MQFEFATATRIVFGRGNVAKLPAIARQFGTRALLVSSQRTADQLLPILEELRKHDVACRNFAVAGEPTVDLVRRGCLEARNSRSELVIGIGGGSSIDGAKAIAALATNSGEPLDYLEVVGRGLALENAPLPFIAIPTSAGTGAEVTRNAVLGSTEHRVKASLRSPLMLAKAAIVDPDLTLSAPPAVTATTGLDTLTQLIEPYVSIRATALTDLFCIEGMRRARMSLSAAFRDGGDRDARESMAFASLLSGLSLSNAGLGVVHGFASPLGGILDAAHGALCAAVLPHGVALNVRALERRDPSSETLKKYAQAAVILTGRATARARDLPEWLLELTKQLAIKTLGQQGLQRDQMASLVENARKASSMKANPIQLTPEELWEIAEQAL